MGLAWATMNPPVVSKSSTRGSGYHQKALAEIRNSLLPFANIGMIFFLYFKIISYSIIFIYLILIAGGTGEVGSSAASTISTLSTTSGVSSASGLSGISGASGSAVDKSDQRQALAQLLAMGYSEVFFFFLKFIFLFGFGIYYFFFFHRILVCAR